MRFAFNTKILLCADNFGDLESLDDKSTCTAAWHSFSNSKRSSTVVVYVCYTVLHRATQGYTVLQCFSATATGESR